MANRQTHLTVGTFAGGAYARYRAKDQDPVDQVVETIGGALTGNLFSRLPDFFDPATSPNHRSFGHGVAPVVSASALVIENMSDWQNSFREVAAKYREAGKNTESILEELWNHLMALLCHLAAGAVAGAPAGYVSYIALDATTPKGLPIVG